MIQSHIFRASIIDVASDSVTVEVTGDEDKVNSLLELLRGFGIKEVARTGRIALTRGEIGPLLTRKDSKIPKQPPKPLSSEMESPPNW